MAAVRVKRRNLGGLGKTKPGYATPGGRKKRGEAEPSLPERHEHEGRTPQPGVPAGSRDTQYPSSSGYEYSPQTYEATGLTPPPAPTRAERREAAAKAAERKQRRSERRAKRIRAIVDSGPQKRPEAPKAPKLPPTAKPPKFEGKVTAGTPTLAELEGAKSSGTLKVNKAGAVTTPKVRQASRAVNQARSVVAKAKPHISGLRNKEQEEFAVYLSKYTKIPPKLAGEWVLQESGASSAGAGGEAGEQNQLGVGYPAHPTSFSESPYFNNTTPQKAAKATAEWMEGKIGQQFGYKAAPSIQGIPKLAKSGASEQEVRSYIEGPSAWGTGRIAQSGVKVLSNGNPKAEAQLQRAIKEAKALGLHPGKAGDLASAGSKYVKVRADAQGMVKWSESALGTKEGSSKQLHWATKEGLSATQPWCANFVSNGLARRGVPLPPNPNYVPSYEHEWTGGRNIGTDLSKAKPGDLIAYSGEHIAVYKGGGMVIGGNQSDEVSEIPVGNGPAGISMILRPDYKGGFVKVKESAALPGSVSPTGSVSESSAPAAVGLVASPEGKAKGKGSKPKAKVPLTVAQVEGKLEALSGPKREAPSTSVLSQLERKYGG